MIRVLALHYSQTGMLGSAFEAVLSGLDPARFEVHREAIRPRSPHPFPWRVGRFFDQMPECVVGDPPPIEPPSFAPDAGFDLVILGYTVWFLAPSLPVQGFFASPHAAVLKDRPVITVVACRNMWHNASLRMKAMVAAAGGRLLDNVVVVDQGPPWATFVTTPRWMFTGRSNAFWIFPAAGVAAQDIRGMDRFGRALSERIGDDGIPEGPLLSGLGAVKVDQKFILPELMGRGLFWFWSRLIRLAGRLGRTPRGIALTCFALFLPFAVLVLVPLCILTRILLYPVVQPWIRRYARRLAAPSGS